MLPGLILAKSFVAPRWSEIPGAYSGKIFCCDPLIRDLRGLFRQNLLLRPAAPISPGLILTKSLAATRCPDIAGAYSDKISCCDPLPRYHWGSFWQNLLLRPLSRYCQGSFWQNLLLSPAVPISSGLILTKSLAKPRWSERSPRLIPTKSLAKPRWSEITGAHFGKIFCCAPLVRFLQGTDSLDPISIPSSAQIHKNTDRQISSLSISIFVCQYLFHQRSVTAGSPSHPRTPAAFLLKETW